jgi:23S rRNA (cytidine1920-2'-O)/16S rRNA (cytidine1409-2'-O)-methyltransferase
VLWVNLVMSHRVKDCRPPILDPDGDVTQARATKSVEKLRLDLVLVDRGLADSRAKAQALILAGRVFSGEQRLEKAGQLVVRDVELRVSEGARYVSRGGVKLEGALAALGVPVADRVCADIGASTGGFTDCLLQFGAKRVYAVDVGEKQLAAELAGDPRVVVMDRTNARFLGAGSFPEHIELAVVDASFIGIGKLLPALAALLPTSAELLALIKPQFEAGRTEAARAQGVIRDPALRARLIDEARGAVTSHGFTVRGGADSVLAGPKGNLEHFLWAVRE